jgi:hypothetical protein
MKPVRSEFRQNKSPFADASGDWCDVSSLSTSHASPNVRTGVIVIIIVGEAGVLLHGRHYSINFGFGAKQLLANSDAVFIRVMSAPFSRLVW